MDGWVDGWMDGWMGGRDGWMDGRSLAVDPVNQWGLVEVKIILVEAACSSEPC